MKEKKCPDTLVPSAERHTRQIGLVVYLRNS